MNRYIWTVTMLPILIVSSILVSCSDDILMEDAIHDRSVLARLHILFGANVDADSSLFGTAIFYHSPGMVKLLIKKGWDVNDPVAGNSPIHRAFIMDHWRTSDSQVKVVELLLQAGADVNSAEDDWKRTPLHLAVENGNIEAIKLLLVKGADPKNKDAYALTPLHYAAQVNNEAIIALLLEFGGDLFIEDEYGQTALHYASEKGAAQVAGFLINQGAEINALDENNLTPLHLASKHNKLNAIELLIEHGADVNARDHLGYSPLHHAAQNGYVEVSNLLLENGADINAHSDGKSGIESPLSLARRRGHEQLIDVLEENGAQDMETCRSTVLVEATGTGKLGYASGIFKYYQVLQGGCSQYVSVDTQRCHKSDIEKKMFSPSTRDGDTLFVHTNSIFDC